MANEAEERKLPPASVVFEAIRLEGEHEIARTPAALAFSGLAAGLSMGFSFIAAGLLRAYLPDAPWRPLIENFGYTTGFLIVILGRQQLFTENTLTPVLPLLKSPKTDTALRVFRLWGIVLAANLIGCAAVAFVLAHTASFSDVVRAAFGSIANDAFNRDLVALFWRAIFAGWLIALTIWLMPTTEGGATALIVMLLTYVIGLGHFSHIVAGSVDTLYAVFTGTASAAQFLIQFFIPTLLGNIVGGVLLVSLLGFAQVQTDISSNQR